MMRGWRAGRRADQDEAVGRPEPRARGPVSTRDRSVRAAAGRAAQPPRIEILRRDEFVRGDLRFSGVDPRFPAGGSGGRLRRSQKPHGRFRWPKSSWFGGGQASTKIPVRPATSQQGSSPRADRRQPTVHPRGRGRRGRAAAAGGGGDLAGKRNPGGRPFRGHAEKRGRPGVGGTRERAANGLCSRLADPESAAKGWPSRSSSLFVGADAGTGPGRRFGGLRGVAGGGRPRPTRAGTTR